MEGLILIAGLAGVIALVAAVSGWQLSMRRRAKQLIARARPCRVAEAREGEIVALTGTIVVDVALRAPMSGRECAYFHLKIEEKVSDMWSVLVEHQRGDAFFVEDETGRARVDGARIDAIVVMDRHRRSGVFENATPDLEQLLARYGRKSTGILGFNNTLRYNEGVLSPSEQVTVIGRAKWVDDPKAQGGYRGGGKSLRLVAPDDRQRVFVTDDPELRRGGRVNAG